MSENVERLEKATDELRQVKETRRIEHFKHGSRLVDEVEFVTGIQRKWLVATGEPILIDGCDGSLEIDKGYTWFGTRLADDYETSFKVISTYAKAREEWRDLPVVEAEENKGAE
jgi:hypothetical protein